MKDAERIENGMIMSDLLDNGEITIDGMTADQWSDYEFYWNS